MKNHKSKELRREKWRNYPDELILCTSQQSWTTAPSLHPDENTTTGCIYGNEQCIAIIDSWAFRFPITEVPRVRLVRVLVHKGWSDDSIYALLSALPHYEVEYALVEAHRYG